MTLTDTIITFLVLFVIFIIVYSSFKRQSLKESWDEFMEWLNPIQNLENE